MANFLRANRNGAGRAEANVAMNIRETKSQGNVNLLDLRTNHLNFNQLDIRRIDNAMTIEKFPITISTRAINSSILCELESVKKASDVVARSMVASDDRKAMLLPSFKASEMSGPLRLKRRLRSTI